MGNRPTPNWAKNADARPDVVAFASGARRLLDDAFPGLKLDEAQRTRGPVTALVYYLGEVADGNSPAYPDPCMSRNAEAAKAAEFWLQEIERAALRNSVASA